MKLMFGKYKGTELSSVPSSYLTWLCKEEIKTLMDDKETETWIAARKELIKFNRFEGDPYRSNYRSKILFDNRDDDVAYVMNYDEYGDYNLCDHHGDHGDLEQ